MNWWGDARLQLAFVLLSLRPLGNINWVPEEAEISICDVKFHFVCIVDAFFEVLLTPVECTCQETAGEHFSESRGDWREIQEKS